MKTKDIDFLYEVGTLRHVPRVWSQFGGIDFANVAEHTFRVMWISAILAKMEGVDVGKVIKMALVHDISETRTGDVHYLSRMYTDRNETSAINDSFSDTTLYSEFTELFKEMHDLKSIEAKIVKDADIIDCDFELVEQLWNGNKLSEELVKVRHLAHKKLQTNAAKQLIKEFLKHSPHDWHTKGVNRATAGDWAVKKE